MLMQRKIDNSSLGHPVLPMFKLFIWPSSTIQSFIHDIGFIVLYYMYCSILCVCVCDPFETLAIFINF